MMVKSVSGGHCDSDDHKKPPHLSQHDRKPCTDDGDDVPAGDDGVSETGRSGTSEGGWSFLVEELANKNARPQQGAAEAGAEGVSPPLPLPPPRRKSRSLSALSTKSLEMCTEGLGCETGFDMTRSIEELIGKPPPAASEPSPTKPAGMISGDKIKARFPPPLTSTTKGRAGLGDGVKMMRPRREGGRLVLTAVSVTRPDFFFLSTRSDGRLMLSFKQ
ncbi:unnamed protein product [Cuscuta epithymum]|uniref:FAF domain-containing protein n=1 Tax=Cuscuta epithymum TaxID=186058 RepID=A0AAV0CZG0_9ASTE|nr:unnamed protein product [Cuscuta epithymum]